MCDLVEVFCDVGGGPWLVLPRFRGALANFPPFRCSLNLFFELVNEHSPVPGGLGWRFCVTNHAFEQH